jgi:hypothetical protein
MSSFGILLVDRLTRLSENRENFFNNLLLRVINIDNGSQRPSLYGLESP